MKRILASTVTAAVLLLGTGSEVESQRRASLFDIGLYGGYVNNTTWATTAQGNLGPGRHNPVLGTTLTFWTSPMFGIRAHLGYIPHGWGFHGQTDFPGFFESSGRNVNTYLYDLNVVFRPLWNADLPALLASTYLFLGGGAITANPPGTDGCLEPGTQQSVCLARDWQKGTIGQGNAGVGVDLFMLGNNFGLFAEAGVHGHSGPEHTGIGWTGVPEPATTTDDFVFTTRAVLGLKLLLGDITPVPVVPPVAPPPPPPPPPPAPPAERTIQVCVIEAGQMRLVEATFVPATGDTVVIREGARTPFRTAFPTGPAFAAGADWFVAGEPITFQNRQYMRFGLPRVMTPPQDQLTQVGEFRGVPLFAEPGAATPPAVVYVPIRPTCEFQPYQREEEVRRVRG